MKEETVKCRKCKRDVEVQFGRNSNGESVALTRCSCGHITMMTYVPVDQKLMETVQ
jgi:hypothetical protein